MLACLDSRAIVKRYVMEQGSDIVHELYERAYSGDITLSFSLWNVGEVSSINTVRGAFRFSLDFGLRGLPSPTVMAPEISCFHLLLLFLDCEYELQSSL